MISKKKIEKLLKNTSRELCAVHSDCCSIFWRRRNCINVSPSVVSQIRKAWIRASGAKEDEVETVPRLRFSPTAKNSFEHTVRFGISSRGPVGALFQRVPRSVLNSLIFGMRCALGTAGRVFLTSVYRNERLDSFGTGRRTISQFNHRA